MSEKLIVFLKNMCKITKRFRNEDLISDEKQDNNRRFEKIKKKSLALQGTNALP